MSELTSLRLNEGTIELNPDRTYTVFGQSMFAVDIIGIDFEHLTWLDQILMLRELELTDSIPMTFHPEVLESLYNEQESSPYYGKDVEAVAAVYRRIQSKQKTEDDIERKLMKPIEWTPTMYSKRGKMVGRLVTLGYDRTYARERAYEFLEVRGEKYMNLTVNQAADRMDQYIRDVESEQGNYITKDGEQPCTLYLVKFTEKNCAGEPEVFIKPGITRRDLSERFSQDKNEFNIEVIHTVEYPTSQCVTREKEIQRRFERYRYTPNKKLKNKGDSEILSIKAPTDEIITLMGSQKVK